MARKQRRVGATMGSMGSAASSAAIRIVLLLREAREEAARLMEMGDVAYDDADGLEWLLRMLAGLFDGATSLASGWQAQATTGRSFSTSLDDGATGD